MRGCDNNKKKKEPNLKLSLAAVFIMFAAITFCIVDSIVNKEFYGQGYEMFMLIFMTLCDVGIVCIILYVIKRIRH